MCVWVDTHATAGVFYKISKYIHAELTENNIRQLIEKTQHIAENRE